MLGQIIGRRVRHRRHHVPQLLHHTPGSTTCPCCATSVPMAVWLFVIWALLLIVATSNAVNLTDGLDSLATGDHPLPRRLRHHRQLAAPPGCINAGAQLLHGARPRPGRGRRSRARRCIAFLWFNAPPPRSSWATPAPALGGLLVDWPSPPAPSCCCWSSAVCSSSSPRDHPVSSFRLTGKRVFRMAPLSTTSS